MLAFSFLLPALVAAKAIPDASLFPRASSTKIYFGNDNSHCLTASSNYDGAPVTIHVCSHSSSAASTWSYTPSSSSAQQIKIYGNKCLDVRGGSTSNGTPMQIWTCDGAGKNKNQLFTPSGGTLKWNGNMCLDLVNGNTNDGAHVQTWTCFNGNTNQRWSNSPSSSSSSSSGSAPTSNKGNINGAFAGLPTKLGLAWASGSAGFISNVQKAKLMYNWSPHNSADGYGSQYGINFLKHCWGWKNFDECKGLAYSNEQSKLWLSINEPNEPGQANMDFWSGISFARQIMKPIRDRGQLVCSPVTSSNPNGLVWVQNFLKNGGSDVEWDITCVHWYDTNFDKFKAYVNLWHDTFGKPVMITEMALQNFNNDGTGQPSMDQQYAFWGQALQWMKETPWILAYFPFSMMPPPTGINANADLMHGDGSLTSLGWEVYNNS